MVHVNTKLQFCSFLVGNPMQPSEVPEPEDFIRYVIEDNKKHKNLFQANLHWRPQSSCCPFCLFDFSIYGHYETISEDTAYILLKNNITELKKVTNLNRDDKNVHHHKERRKQFWSQISQRHLSDLLEIFKSDFDLFGY